MARINDGLEDRRDVIGFAEAFQRIAFDLLSHSPEAVTELHPALAAVLDRQSMLLRDRRPDILEDEHREELADCAANLFLRAELMTCNLVAHVLPPDQTGTIALSNNGWFPSVWWRKEFRQMIPPIVEDYVVPGDLLNPGPDEVLVRRRRLRVFFLKHEFSGWRFKRRERMQVKEGRPRGSGFQSKDSPVLERMRRLFDDGKVTSIEAALNIVLPDAYNPNRSSSDSVKNRLRIRYRERYKE